MSNTAIAEYFTEDEPFGPIVSPDMKDMDIMQTLFCKDNLIYHEMKLLPSLIIGRRGAGKTALLRSIYFDKRYKHVVELPAEVLFRQIISAIEEMSKNTLFVEEVARLWTTVFWHLILKKIAQCPIETNDIILIKKYIKDMGL